MDFKQHLASLQDAYKPTDSGPGGDRVEVEAGLYIARLERGEFRERAKGDPFMVLNWTITEGEHESVDLPDWNLVRNEVGLGYATRKLAALGADLPEDAAKLPDVLEEIVAAKPVARVKVEIDGGFRNVSVNKLLAEFGDGFKSGDDFDFGANATVEVEVEAEPAEDEPAEDEDGVDIHVGMKVEVEGKGEGEVTELDETNGLLKVKLNKSKKTVVTTPGELIVL